MAKTPSIRPVPKWFYRVPETPRSKDAILREMQRLEKRLRSAEARGAYNALLWALRVRHARAVSDDVPAKKGGA